MRRSSWSRGASPLKAARTGSCRGSSGVPTALDWLLTGRLVEAQEALTAGSGAERARCGRGGAGRPGAGARDRREHRPCGCCARATDALPDVTAAGIRGRCTRSSGGSSSTSPVSPRRRGGRELHGAASHRVPGPGPDRSAAVPAVGVRCSALASSSERWRPRSPTTPLGDWESRRSRSWMTPGTSSAALVAQTERAWPSEPPRSARRGVAAATTRVSRPTPSASARAGAPPDDVCECRSTTYPGRSSRPGPGAAGEVHPSRHRKGRVVPGFRWAGCRISPRLARAPRRIDGAGGRRVSGQKLWSCQAAHAEHCLSWRAPTPMHPTTVPSPS